MDKTAAGAGREKTIAYKILRAHETQGETREDRLKLKFDALVSHDITYVSIIQTARAAGMTKFPIPYVLTNCHNSLCAVGGTINEDDHAFGLSAAKKYGGIYVPGNQAVIHQYMREVFSGGGKMILGSDSHTRYGCYGTLGVGEGGGELVRQLLGHTYDIDPPEVVLIWLEGEPKKGVGPHDVALALIKETFFGGKVKNKILEFAGPGIRKLPMDFRAGIDVMTTETTCLTSIWETDEAVREYYKNVGRPDDFKKLQVTDGACYDAVAKIDLSQIESMIALPFHPSKAFTIHELQKDAEKILQGAQNDCNSELGGETGSGEKTGKNNQEQEKVKLDLKKCIGKDGKIICEQGIVVGCAGGMFDNISEVADILEDNDIGNGYFDLSIYPASAPISLAITENGISQTLLKAGVVIKPAFCGPCFGAGDTPAHNTLSIRHATRNFASREGSKPANNQIAAVALMDARSIAATAMNKGVLTAATDINYTKKQREYRYSGAIYEKRVYNGFGKPDPAAELRIGPNITGWPKFHELKDNMLIKLCAVIFDDVTTTDELIPSGETSSYRSNPIALAEHTLCRRVPGYVKASKDVRDNIDSDEVAEIFHKTGADKETTSVGSCIFAKKPGDGSAREQAASCQRVLGALCNIAFEYATKRYRSNCINWGIIPFTIDKDDPVLFKAGDWIYIKGIKDALKGGHETIRAKLIPQAAKTATQTAVYDITLKCEGLGKIEREIIAQGCLMNYYAGGSQV
ncbi:MAG: hydratase [Oscillospiraceae bacterium]|nr:hydratase [Oscillospiraceae bacterium]